MRWGWWPLLLRALFQCLVQLPHWFVVAQPLSPQPLCPWKVCLPAACLQSNTYGISGLLMHRRMRLVTKCEERRRHGNAAQKGHWEHTYKLLKLENYGRRWLLVEFQAWGGRNDVA